MLKTRIWQWLKNNIVIVIMAVIAFAVAVNCFFAVTYVDYLRETTTSDWDYLYERLAILETRGLEAAYEMEDIKLTVEGKSVTIETEQCALEFERDNENNFIETARTDKAYYGMGYDNYVSQNAFSCVVLGFVVFGVEWLIFLLIQWIFEKIKLLKCKS